jgi:hypothetical protein
VTFPSEPQSLIEAVAIQTVPYPSFHPINPRWSKVTNFLPSSTVEESQLSHTCNWQDSPWKVNSAYFSTSNVSGADTLAAMSYGYAGSDYCAEQLPFGFDSMLHLYILYPHYGRPTQSPMGDVTWTTSPVWIPAMDETSAPHSALVVPTPFCAPHWNTFGVTYGSNMDSRRVGNSMYNWDI